MDDLQRINPELFVLVGELLGNVMANQMPLNVQNSVGNWLTLVGQVILTYNAQQQLYEQGPGRCFNPEHFYDNPINDPTQVSPKQRDALTQALSQSFGTTNSTTVSASQQENVTSTSSSENSRIHPVEIKSKSVNPQQNQTRLSSVKTVSNIAIHEADIVQLKLIMQEVMNRIEFLEQQSEG